MPHFSWFCEKNGTFGTPERTWTFDLPLRRRLRYPLRYWGLCNYIQLSERRTFRLLKVGWRSTITLGGGCSIQLSYMGICGFIVPKNAAVVNRFRYFFPRRSIEWREQIWEEWEVCANLPGRPIWTIWSMRSQSPAIRIDRIGSFFCFWDVFQKYPFT